MDTLQEKLQLYKIEIAKDSGRALVLASDFQASIHTPAMALVRCAEDVIHTSAEVLPLEARSRERWAAHLERLKDNLHSAVNLILQTLNTVSSYYRYYNKADSWCSLVLCENFLQELLEGVHGDTGSRLGQKSSWGTLPAWRRRLATFLKKHPPPNMEELLQVAHLANAIPDDAVQQAGKQAAHRCTTLRKLLISSGPVSVRELQLALQWQAELLRSRRVEQTWSPAADQTARDSPHSPPDTTKADRRRDAEPPVAAAPSLLGSGRLSECKPSSVSSLDSGFDGAGSGQLETSGARELVDLPAVSGSRDSTGSPLSQPHTHDETLSSIWDCEDQREGFGSVGNSPGASIQIIPKLELDSLNLQIRVRRSAALPSNPWLSLPVDDLENSYTVTITQSRTPQKGELRSHDPSDPHVAPSRSPSPDRPTQAEAPGGWQDEDWTPCSPSALGDPERSPICSVLSSTITSETDESLCPTEGNPTLLWDSYDLHDEESESVDGLTDISLEDWHVKEQEGLGEVEKILERTDEILKEEESVLAQEAVLDVLLRSEDDREMWPPWDSEDQQDPDQQDFLKMSPRDVAEAGVPGVEENLHATEPGRLCGQGSVKFERESETFAEELRIKAKLKTEGSLGSRPDLLAELRNVNILDELIIEENLQILKLRRGIEGHTDGPVGGDRPRVPSAVNEGKEALRLQLEREKRELEKLEKSLNKDCTLEKNEDEVGELVKCPTMEPSEQNLSQCQNLPGSDADQSLCDRTSLSRPLALEQVSKAAVQPQPRTSERELEDSTEKAKPHTPEASVSLEMKLDEGAFDSGVKPTLLPELGQRPSPVLGNNGLTEVETPHPTGFCPAAPFTDQHLGNEQLDALPENITADFRASVFLNPNIKEHRNNNNNHAIQQPSDASLQTLTEIPCEAEEKTLVGPARLQHPDVQPTEKLFQFVPQIHGAQPLEPDPRGREELPEDVPDVAQGSEGARVSHCVFQRVQAKFNDDLREMTSFRTPIVLDTGSGLMKAGFADQEFPSIIFPTIIGMPKYEEIMNLEKESYIGHDAQHMRGVLLLRHPIKNGVIHNWDDMEKIWHHTFQQLCVDPEEHPVLLTEAAMNPLENRQRMVELMFECFNVPFTYVAMQAVLALYAAGRTTGVVFDSGDGVSHSVPVFEGYCLPHAVQRFPLAGADVTMQLKKLLQEQGVCMRTTAELEIVREMKERCCFVAQSRTKPSCGEMHHTLPDGRVVTLDTERFRAPEILFKPELVGREHNGMHESIFKSVLSSDIDLRRCLLENIVLSGGNTLLPGLPERLQAEILGLLPADMGVNVHISSPRDRDFSVWSGGAVLANLPSFSSAWISQEEYEEYGPQIVFRKCF
ncbi:uncharacterized protein LOC133418651 isoform X2 [Cololabis saira]|nr:uncharacterized protein LOC133418651 isoform X2 [Cololabis saira]